MEHAIVRYRSAEPPDLVRLDVEARAEGYGIVHRTHEEWANGFNRFDRPGEAFFMAVAERTVVGICGINVDPYMDNPGVGRLRHLYVSPSHRRHGLGHRLVEACLDGAGEHFSRIRLRTYDTGADAFYRSLGFEKVDEELATHSILPS